MSYDDVRDFLDLVDGRLDGGAAEYGDQSFVKPVAETEREILEESVDQVGWLYVLWCQAARKTNLVRDQVALRQIWRERLDHRFRRNDRRLPTESGDRSVSSLMADIEILALDLFLKHLALVRRLRPLVRALEVAQAVSPRDDQHRGRRGGRCDSRSDD